MPKEKKPKQSKKKNSKEGEKEPHHKTPTFLLELPLCANAGQARRLRAHFEVARLFYNAMLSEAKKRLDHMRADPAWQAARAIPRAQKQERSHAFSQLRQQYQFSEYALHAYATQVRKCPRMADHLDVRTAQKLATRAFQATNRVALGQAKKIRFRSKGRGLDSLEGKTNEYGLRFVLQDPKEGNGGWLVWRDDRLPAIIDWDDVVVSHGLGHRIKYTRLVRRKASSSNAQGADCEGNRYYVQLALEGIPHVKKKNQPGSDTIGLDIGPSSLAIVSQQGHVQLTPFCEELKPNARKKRRLQRKMERQRSANNPDNYDEKGRIKKGRKHRKESRRYQQTRQQLANTERRTAAHRKSLHGYLVNCIIRLGKTIQIEQTSFKSWRKMFGKSVSQRAPGMFYEHLKRTVAKTGGTLREVGTYKTKLSQYCHGCKTYHKKPLSQRWHQCGCGIGPIQRDLYSAFLLAFLKPAETIPSIYRHVWEGAEPRLRAEVERLSQRANEGYLLPGSMGIPRARARQLKSPDSSQQGLLFQFRKGRVETLGRRKEPKARKG
jgi:hypothetical protein